ncbi:hypothetical protein Anas_00023 [Armadillidium nasatum]|uniref:N-acetyltransferase domain-containing protein n=1 Tax=Armadillidium nasatum TaxID=96803 RepID=A0A5N5T6L3_9CRUS|nr:hypothetical protein Anas_00023 [Armadillidium nasatum]
MTEGTKASFKPEDFELRSLQGKDYTEILELFREHFLPREQILQMLLKILNHIESTVNIFEDEKLEKVLELAAITVNPKFSGQRIVYRLIEETEKRARQMGCQLITTQAANIISQHVFVKAGYETISEVDYETLELDGKRPLKVSNMNGTTKAIVVKNIFGN